MLKQVSWEQWAKGQAFGEILSFAFFAQLSNECCDWFLSISIKDIYMVHDKDNHSYKEVPIHTSFLVSEKLKLKGHGTYFVNCSKYYISNLENMDFHQVHLLFSYCDL